jgi:hypothetical protein
LLEWFKVRTPRLGNQDYLQWDCYLLIPSQNEVVVQKSKTKVAEETKEIVVLDGE